MIQANELRIGNWVYNFLGQPIKCTWENIKWSKDIMAIPITEEILLKCGFDKYLKMYLVDNDFCSMSLMYRHDRMHLVINTEPADLSRINKLHQLQNLYFALTGQELNIEL